MIKVKRMSAFINNHYLGVATGFDLARQPDYSVESLFLWDGYAISLIKSREIMKNIDHLNPFYRHFNSNHLIVGGRGNLKKYLVIRLLDQQTPELKFNIELDFPFLPQHIRKVKSRKVCKACYQSFMLYKKSFKPVRIPRIRTIKDENPWFKYDDHIDDTFRQQYLNAWGDDIESKVFKGWNGIKGVIHRERKS